MKDINYKDLKNIVNSIPKLDIGTRPISGYQRNADQTQAGYITQNVTPVTNAFVPQAISNGISNIQSPLLSIGQNTAKYISTYNTALKTATEEAFNKVAASGMDMTSVGAKEGVKAAAKSTAKTAASKAVGAANIALNAYSAIHGGLGLYNNWTDSSTLTAADISNTAARSTEYTNGVAYERMGGYDVSGVDKYVRDQNKASKMEGATSGFEAGAGVGGLVGSLFPGAGTFIGAGIGGVVGAVAGLFGGSSARRERERAIEEAKRNYAFAVDAYNTQGSSEAASAGLRNIFNATHGIGADCGKGVKRYNKGKQPALVGQGEVQGTVDSNGNIVEAHTVDSPNGMHRLDNLLTFLGDNDFVLGNKKDQSGTEVSQYARMHERMFNSGNPTLQKLGEEGLKNDLELQKRLPKNSNPNPFDILMANDGKNMKKNKNSWPLWEGAEIPLAAFTANYLDDLARQKEISRTPIQAYNAYVPNKYLTQAGALMPSTYDINPQRQTINNEARFANYAINQSAYSPGQKMAMLSNMWNKRMKAMSDLMGEKQQQENTMRANYARWLSDVGAQDQQLMSAYRDKYFSQLAQANARKFNAKQQLRADRRQNWNDLAQNLYNVYFGNKNIGLYAQKLSNESKSDLMKMGNYWSPLDAFKPYNIKSPLEKGS